MLLNLLFSSDSTQPLYELPGQCGIASDCSTLTKTCLEEKCWWLQKENARGEPEDIRPIRSLQRRGGGCMGIMPG